MGTRTDRCGGSGEGDQASQVPRPGMDKPAAPSDSALPGAAGRTADPFMSLPVSLPISLPVDPASLVLVLAAYLLAGMVKGALGFGLPLTAIAILAFVVPIEIALGVNAVMLFATNVVQLGRSGLAVPTMRRHWPLVLGILAGAVAASMLLTGLDRDALRLILGVAISVFALLTLFAPTLAVPERHDRPIGLGAGLLAGASAALTTVNGPIFVIYLVGLGLDRRAMIAALGLALLTTGVAISGAFLKLGLLDGPRLLLAFACLGPALVGMAIGNRLAERLPAERFRTVLLWVVFALGLNLVWGTLMA